MAKLIPGKNDLATLHPEIAAEADGWDPSMVLPRSGKKFSWKCEKGHAWDTTPDKRIGSGRGCPYCANKKVWIGFNDLKTFFPDLAAEADGWDPVTVTWGSNQKKSWKCEKGHKWTASVGDRTGSRKTGCPYCSNNKVWVGFNDLKTKYPEIAKEAHRWDPESVAAQSNKKRFWKCEKGHLYETTPSNRTGVNKAGCPYCSNQKVLVGFNDLKTRFPEIAKEAHGWDPSKVMPFSQKEFSWKCQKGHIYKAHPSNRVGGKSGCPYCSNQKVLVGFNDLKTRFPDVAAEANGWDPETVTAGANQKKPWRCKEGHTWTAIVASRTGSQSCGCPKCAEYGYNPGKPAWFYLMKRSGEQQFGITNFLDQRLKTHARDGWQKIESTGPHDGQKVFETEQKLRQWLKVKIGLVPDKRENWYTSKMEVHSLAELKEKTGIETSIF